MRERDELAYCAGVIDGEGCFSLQKMRSGAVHPRLTIEQYGSPEILHRVEGFIRIGKVSRTKKGWRYEANGFEKVQAVLAMTFDYLTEVKQDDAIYALKSFLLDQKLNKKELPPHGTRARYYKDCRCRLCKEAQRMANQDYRMMN